MLNTTSTVNLKKQIARFVVSDSKLIEELFFPELPGCAAPLYVSLRSEGSNRLCCEATKPEVPRQATKPEVPRQFQKRSLWWMSSPNHVLTHAARAAGGRARRARRALVRASGCLKCSNLRWCAFRILVITKNNDNVFCRYFHSKLNESSLQFFCTDFY